MKKILFPLLVCLATSAIAQNNLPVPANIMKAIRRGTRTNDGSPGKNYWQNRADYTIDVHFDPATGLLSGSEEIMYENNSPDTLKEIVFKLYPNLYKKGAIRMMKIDAEDETDGMNIQSIKTNGEILQPTAYRTDGTNMFLKTKAILPGQKTKLNISFSYTLNKGSHIRTGQVDSGAFFIAYYFPRIAVYDDIDGWNRLPYIGTQEFYNDFCNFKTTITVPGEYAVWATGDLKNCDEVFAEKICRRIKQAESSDAVMNVIDSSDIASKTITKSGSTNTWRFESNNVTDAVFAISNHYIWQSSSLVVDSITGRRTRADAVFNAAHKDYFFVAADARKTIESMSFRFPKWPYPYNHETVFDGLDQMEYPMMVNDNPLEDRAESVELTDHEIFHTMFPFYMGINETKYSWMDEGWATIGEWLISPMIDSTITDEYGLIPTRQNAGTENDLPITTLTTQIGGVTAFLNNYPKPAFGYLYVKDMLGDELFFKALHHYFKNWAGKHPLPNDFFYCMNAGSGKNMNWFWESWFYGNGIPDLGFKKIIPGKKNKEVIIESRGTKPLPIDLLVTYTDSTTQKFHQSIAAWEKGNKTVSIKWKSDKEISTIRLGSLYVTDAHPEDNFFDTRNVKR